MKTVKKNETRKKNIAQKGVLFLVLCLMTMIFACGKSSGQAADSDITDIDIADIDIADIDIADIDLADIDFADIDNSDFDQPDLDEHDVDITDEDDTDEDNTEQDINVDLGLVSTFAIASAAGIKNTGATQINGDVILDPDYSCNEVPSDNMGGFGDCEGFAPTISGEVITNTYPDTVTSSAIMADLKAAYLSIMKANLPNAIVLGCETIGSNGDAGALIGCAGNSTLAPGVYISATDASIGVTGVLTLDGQGDENAQFVFQAPSSTLTTASGSLGFPLSEIKLINGTKASNVWWQVGSSATIGAYSVFVGNVLADSSITMETGATSCGRLLAGAFTTSGAFIFDSNVVSVPGNGCPF